MSEDSSLAEKIKKKFFGRTKTGTTVGASTLPVIRELIFTAELLKDISPESPANHRLKTIRELCEIVSTKRLEENAVEALWLKIQDLIHPSKPTETRQVALTFLNSLIKGQYQSLRLLRHYFLLVVKRHESPDDLGYRLNILRSLTENGKDLVYLEDDLGEIMLLLMPQVIHSGCYCQQFLSMLCNIIKYNAAYVEEHIIVSLIRQTCITVLQAISEDIVESCIEFLEAVVCYSYLPYEALYDFIECLCRTVSIEKFCQISWKLMRNLLGTHLGYSAIFTMCQILNNPDNVQDHILLRGAVFFVGMALWGSKKVTSLKQQTPCSVLPSFFKSLECNHSVVAYEVVLSLQRLIKKYGKELQPMTWDILLDILENMIDTIEVTNSNSALVGNIQDIFATTEKIYESGQFCGSTQRFFSIVEKCTLFPNVSSVLLLIQFRAKAIHPSNGDWINNLNQLMEKYFRCEKRTKIRLKVLEMLTPILSRNMSGYEEDLIELVILPQFSHIDEDEDPEIRNMAVQILLEWAHACGSHRCNELLSLLEKVIKRSMTMSGSMDKDKLIDILRNESAFVDIKTAISGLIHAFKVKLYKLPTNHVCTVYNLILSHVKTHYTEGYLSETSTAIRLATFSCFLSVRADSHDRIGLLESENKTKIHFSPFIFCANRHTCTYLEENASSSAHTSPSVDTPDVSMTLHVSAIPFSDTFRVYLSCLEKERDWRVLSMVLEHLPNQLQNKTLILSSGCEVSALSTRICAMVSDRSLDPATLYIFTPPKFNRSDYHGYLFPVLAILATYFRTLDKTKQRDLIRCLEFGLVSKCAKVCVTTLTICMFEMKESMMRQMPPLLRRLAQISATVQMASPMLEFLSSLIHVPKMYANFVEEQYRSIFAIALSYTDPFRYNHYVVSLAHHVIAMWFLKCRLSFRKDLVKFISKGLQANVLHQFKEGRHSANLEPVEIPRTGSLGESMMKKPGGRTNRAVSDLPTNESTLLADPGQPMQQFHQELTETCIDTLVRYTFSNCSSMPKRTPVTDFLLLGGQSQTWLLGNKLVTITTSSGQSLVGKAGLCERCSSVCRDRADENEGTDDSSFLAKRRRHKSEISPSTSSAQISATSRSIDDIGLHRQSSNSDGAAKSKTQLCSCWCQGWAEIYIRRPTGNVAWLMHLENGMLQPLSASNEFPLDDISTLFHLPFNMETEEASLIHHEALAENEYDSLHEEFFQVFDQSNEEVFEKSAEVATHAVNDGADNTDKLGGHQVLRRYNSNPELAVNAPKLRSTSDLHLQAIRKSIEVSSGEISVDANETTCGQSETITVHRPRLLSQMSVELPRDSGVTVSQPVDAFPQRKPRGNTFHSLASSTTSSSQESVKSGFSPSFVFLQLYHSPYMNKKAKPSLLPQKEVVQRSIKNFDRIPSYETHKIGVLYIGPDQAANATSILSNKFGSVRYAEFLQGLGKLIKLSTIDQEHTYIGGLDTRGNDGKFAYCWHDELTQVIFHVATLMPNKPSDPNCDAKKLHIGNDFVTIIFNESDESGDEYVLGTIKGQFNYVNIVIQPLDNETNAVTLKVKEEMNSLMAGNDTKVISDASLPTLVRQVALHSDLASLILQRQKTNPTDPYASNWLERLRQIKRIKSKVETDNVSGHVGYEPSFRLSGVEDFAGFV